MSSKCMVKAIVEEFGLLEVLINPDLPDGFVATNWHPDEAKPSIIASSQEAVSECLSETCGEDAGE